VYNYFKAHFPISDQTGTDLVLDTKNSLHALRDAITVDAMYGWNYTNSAAMNPAEGTYSQPDFYNWYKSIDGVIHTIRATVTSWGTYGASIIVWTYSSNGIALAIGTETTTWDANGNFIQSAWSGSPTIELFEREKPVVGDAFLQTIDYIRENLLAVRDDLIGTAGHGYKYYYTVGNGSAQMPQNLFWSDLSKPTASRPIMKGVIVYDSNESVTSISWVTSNNGGSLYYNVGTINFVYTSEGYCSTAIWSTPANYTQFEDNRPIITESDADNIIVDIKNNLNALHDGAIMNIMPFWNYSRHFGTASNPYSERYTKGALQLEIINTYGASGPSINCPTQRTYSYSTDSGSTRFIYGRAVINYGDDGIVSTTTWHLS